MSESLQNLLRDLALRSDKPSAPGIYLAHPVARGSNHFIAIDINSAPTLLLNSENISQAVVPPLKLRGIHVAYGMPCNLQLPSGSRTQHVLTTITCKTSDPLERAFFIDCCETLLRIVGESPSLNAVIAATEHLSNVFQRLGSPARESITGIIGELLIIDLSPNPYTAIAAWRQHPEDRYDFSLDSIRLEVKSSSSRNRIHYLTYEQCSPPLGTIGLLASIIIESAGGGQSLRDLITSIETRVIDDHQCVYRLRGIVADTLGETLARALEERFDRALAEASVQLYDLRSVPAIRGLLPPGVVRVKFQSDVTLSRQVRISQFLENNPRIGEMLRL